MRVEEPSTVGRAEEQLPLVADLLVRRLGLLHRDDLGRKLLEGWDGLLRALGPPMRDRVLARTRQPGSRRSWVRLPAGDQTASQTAQSSKLVCTGCAREVECAEFTRADRDLQDRI